MAQYHTRAEQLKPLVEKAGFTTDQLNLIHKMMRGCTMLRQGKVIDSFLTAMLPAGYTLKQGEEVQGHYGPYRPTYVVKDGEVVVGVPMSLGEDEE